MKKTENSQTIACKNKGNETNLKYCSHITIQYSKVCENRDVRDQKISTVLEQLIAPNGELYIDLCLYKLIYYF